MESNYAIAAPSRKHNPENDNLVINYLVMISQKCMIEDGDREGNLYIQWIGEEYPIIVPYTGYEDHFFRENETEFQKKHREEMQRDPQLPKVFQSRREALDAIESHEKSRLAFKEEGYYYSLIPFRSNSNQTIEK